MTTLLLSSCGPPWNNACKPNLSPLVAIAMRYGIWFSVVFVGFFVVRGIATTWLFLFLLPRSDRCPNCDEVTLRVQAHGWNRFLPWFRTSWCYRCGWEGLLREQPTESLRDSGEAHGHRF